MNELADMEYPRILCVCGNHKFSMSIIDIKPGGTENILYEYQPIYVCTECNRIYTMSEWSDMTLQAVNRYLEVNE